MNDLESEDAAPSDRFWRRRAQRAHIINSEPTLRGRARAAYYELERVLADAIGADLGQARNGTRAPRGGAHRRLGAAELYETDDVRALPAPPAGGDLLALVDRVISFTRPGIAGST